MSYFIINVVYLLLLYPERPLSLTMLYFLST